MAIVASITFPGPRKDEILVRAPFDTPETATAAMESLIVGGLAVHVRDVRVNKVKQTVEVYAIGCSCFGHTIEDADGKKAKPQLALSFDGGPIDEHSIEVVRELLTKGASEVVISVFEEDDEKPEKPADEKPAK